jgi:glucose/arabinose dehydrogenase
MTQTSLPLTSSDGTRRGVILNLIKRFTLASLYWLILVGLLAPANAGAEFSVPAGFIDQAIVGGVPEPTSFDWLPGGNLLITAQGGNLFGWNGAGDARPVLDLSGAVCDGGEMGLLGIAVDPEFQSGQRFIYLYYTRRGAGSDGCDPANRANRVSRFSVDKRGEIGGETILVDNIRAPGGNHNGGDLQFDRNSLLFISVGDGGSTPETARSLASLNGKILRIDRHGGIPGGNPFTGAGTESCRATGASTTGQTCQEIYATGLRNPFRLAIDPDGGGQFFVNDVGAGNWEEVDVGAPGADYGWNVREGPCLISSSTNCPQPSGFVEPIHAYPHQTGCRTITGGAFVPDAAGWPSGSADDYLFADLACSSLFALDTATAAVSTFATGAGAVHLKFGSDGALYYSTYEDGGQVRRIDEATKDKCKKGTHRKGKAKKNSCKKDNGGKGKDKRKRR